MAQRGVVTKLEGLKRAVIILENCEECHECEFSRFCKVGSGGRTIIVRNEKGAEPGDTVEIDSSGRNMIVAGTLNFLLPVILIIGGIFAGLRMWNSELHAFIFAISLTAVYFFVFTFLDKSIIRKGIIIPEIVNILEEGENNICPSCGKSINPEEGIFWNGLRFCSDECIEDFK